MPLHLSGKAFPTQHFVVIFRSGDRAGYFGLLAQPSWEAPRKIQVHFRSFTMSVERHISTGSVQLTASTKTDRDLREDRDGRKSCRQETAGTTHR
jgi:hypothetical protein